MNLLVEFCETQRKKISQWQRYPIHYAYYTKPKDIDDVIEHIKYFIKNHKLPDEIDV